VLTPRAPRSRFSEGSTASTGHGPGAIRKTLTSADPKERSALHPKNEVVELRRSSGSSSTMARSWRGNPEALGAGGEKTNMGLSSFESSEQTKPVRSGSASESARLAAELDASRKLGAIRSAAEEVDGERSSTQLILESGETLLPHRKAAEARELPRSASNQSNRASEIPKPTYPEAESKAQEEGPSTPKHGDESINAIQVADSDCGRESSSRSKDSVPESARVLVGSASRPPKEGRRSGPSASPSDPPTKVLESEPEGEGVEQHPVVKFWRVKHSRKVVKDTQQKDPNEKAEALDRLLHRLERQLEGEGSQGGELRETLGSNPPQGETGPLLSESKAEFEKDPVQYLDSTQHLFDQAADDVHGALLDGLPGASSDSIPLANRVAGGRPMMFFSEEQKREAEELLRQQQELTQRLQPLLAQLRTIRSKERLSTASFIRRSLMLATWDIHRLREINLTKLITLLDRKVGVKHCWLRSYLDENVYLSSGDGDWDARYHTMMSYRPGSAATGAPWRSQRLSRHGLILPMTLPTGADADPSKLRLGSEGPTRRPERPATTATIAKRHYRATHFARQ
jgi:hypothetical protein